MPELAQLFCVAAENRGPTEILETLLRHRVFRVIVTDDAVSSCEELERSGFRVTPCRDAEEARDLIHRITGSWALVAGNEATRTAARGIAGARDLPVLDI